MGKQTFLFKQPSIWLRRNCVKSIKKSEIIKILNDILQTRNLNIEQIARGLEMSKSINSYGNGEKALRGPSSRASFVCTYCSYLFQLRFEYA